MPTTPVSPTPTPPPVSAPISTIIAAPSIIKLGGKEYKLSAPRDCDFADMERFAQSEYMRFAREQADMFEGDEKISFMSKMIDNARQMTMTGERSKEVTEMMNSMAGAIRLLWLLLKKNHPELTEEDIGRMMTEEALAESFDAINVMMDKEDESMSGEAKAASSG